MDAGGFSDRQAIGGVMSEAKMTYTIEELKKAYPSDERPVDVYDHHRVVPELIREFETKEQKMETGAEWTADEILLKLLSLQVGIVPPKDMSTEKAMEHFAAYAGADAARFERGALFVYKEISGLQDRCSRLRWQEVDLTRQLRAQEITAVNERLRTARECAEIAWELAESYDRNESFPSLHAVGAMTAAAAIRRKFEVPE